MAVVNQDIFFSKLFQTGMSDPNSRIYLPKILTDTQNPSLNPYTMDRLDLGQQTIGVIPINVLLTNISIKGIPSVSVNAQEGGSFVFTGLNTAIIAQFCTLSPPPPNVNPILALSADFALSFTGNQLTGTLEVTIDKAALNAQMLLSGDQLINIITTINSLQASVPDTAAITPKVTFDSGGGEFWPTAFSKFIKKKTTIDAIVAKVNDELNSTGTKDNLSRELTTIFQNAIRQQLNP